MTAAPLARWSPPEFRSSAALLAVALGLAAVPGAAGAARAEGPAVPPTALAAVASASPQMELPAGGPQALVATSPAPGSSGPTVARGEGKVAAGRPMSFVFRAETAGLTTIGVASPQSAARLSIFRGNSSEAASSTSVTDGAIRWSSELAAGETVKILVYTGGGEIPFRVEAYAGPGGL